MKTPLKKQLSGIVLNVFLMAVTFMLFAGLIEGGLRIGRIFSGTSAEEKLYDYDPLLGWKTKPNLNTALVREGRKILLTTNSKGFRGPEITYVPASDERRVLIVGKSFAQAVQVRFEELFSEQLKGFLADKLAESVKVINTGTAGHSTDQQLLLFREEGVRYSPDLTIAMFHDNDVWYNNQDYFFDKAKPRFELSGGQLVLTSTPVSKNPPKQVRTEFERSSPGLISGAKAWLTSYSLFYQWIRERVRGNPLLFQLSVRWGLSGKNLSGIPDDFRVWKRHRDPDIDEAWKLTEKLLLQLKQEAEKAGSDFVVFYVPSRGAIVPSQWMATLVRYGLADTQWNVNQVAEDLRALCQKNKIALIEPTREFVAAANSPSGSQQKLLYYVMDSHWTPEGHRVAAQVMAQWILAHPFRQKVA